MATTDYYINKSDGYYQAEINRVSSSYYSYNASTEEHTFIASGSSVVNSETGSFLKGFPTREIFFEFTFKAEEIDLQNSNDYIVLWKMDTIEGAEADFNHDPSRSFPAPGFGPMSSLQLRYIDGGPQVCFITGALDNPPTTGTNGVAPSQSISLNTEYTIRIVHQTSGANASFPIINNNGVARVVPSPTSDVLSNLRYENIYLGWNGDWRPIPYWGCILSNSVAARGNENRIILKNIYIGETLNITDSFDRKNVSTDQQRAFRLILGDTNRVYDS